ncbi:hypothetical protein AnigIFM50267_004023 [Aspergillus niger]|nr:hypothetical protein AnigIFM50267_004023 [Aspergillus niger]
MNAEGNVEPTHRINGEGRVEPPQDNREVVSESGKSAGESQAATQLRAYLSRGKPLQRPESHA